MTKQPGRRTTAGKVPAKQEKSAGSKAKGGSGKGEHDRDPAHQATEESARVVNKKWADKPE